MSHKPPKILSTQVIATSRIFQVEQLDLRFSNGEERQFERLKAGRRGAVMVIPRLGNELVLIREYAAGIEDYVLGFPKGLCDPGETNLQAANRELQEEAGYQAKQLTFLKRLSLAPGYLSHQMDVVLADDLSPSKLPGDEPEPLEVITWPTNKISELLERDDFTESRSIAALSLLTKFIR